MQNFLNEDYIYTCKNKLTNVIYAYIPYEKNIPESRLKKFNSWVET